MAKKNKRRGPAPLKDAGRVKTPAEILGVPEPTAAQLSRRGGRETMDALVVAFVLAFLIRTYVAEAFVIPTGSMAPTLMGQHKDVFCDQCGVRFKVNSSDDSERYLAQIRKQREQLDAEIQQIRLAVNAGRLSSEEAQRRINNGEQYYARQIESVQGLVCVGGECPQCRRLMPLSNGLPAELRPAGSDSIEQTADYSGDRLVVSKYAYSFANPERWDVAVFKYPGDSEVNYIKRVTGLPGEELRIFQGDLYTRPLGTDEPFAIASKPAEQAMSMRQFVHDTHHESAKLINAGWPLAWSASQGWKPVIDKALRKSARGAEVLRLTYEGESPAGETRWLRYRHTPPNENVWNRVLEGGGEKMNYTPQPELITDFTPYNTRLTLTQVRAQKRFTLEPRDREDADLGSIGAHWVSDLMVEAEVTAEGEACELSLDLVDSGEHFGVTIQAADGSARFWRRAFEGNETVEIASASTPVRAGSAHRLRLANFDNRLLLWVDETLIDADAAYETPQSQGEGDATAPRSSDTDKGDLAPVGVGVSGGDATVARLRVWRDGYYLAASHREPRSNFTTDLSLGAFEPEDQRNWSRSVKEMTRDPDLWYAFANRRRVDFEIDEGQLFVMGDNSGHSLDARLWKGGNGGDLGRPGGAYLEDSQLVGKAICVYWPHSWYSVGPLPVWPNFGDMRLVR
ncbi:signal peptidase I [Planctomycetes bacterium MalM25]|nr:signal peptidase I [Planctomycetes bacterium MalM25]